MLKESVLNVEVSCFRNYDTPQNPVTINLMTWLTSTKYKDKVEVIRGMDDKAERDRIKATLPAITPSGIFSYRRESNLVKHSGLIQIDLDLTEKNKLITNWTDLKSELIKIPQIAYLGKSVSGRGYWGLIPIPPDPEDHKFYFDALHKIFLNNWGIELDDKPKNVASLRGYSFDSEAYFNHEAKAFLIKKIPIPKPVPIAKKVGIKTSGLEEWIIKKLETSQEGERHGDRLNLARYAGGLVAGGHLDSGYEERLIQSYLSQYGHLDSRQIQAKEIKAIQDGFKDGKKFPTHPPRIKCMFVPFNRLEDYSNKAFKITQGKKFFFIPKSQTYKKTDSGIYVTESFFSSDPKSPKWESNSWKEFDFDSVNYFEFSQDSPPEIEPIRARAKPDTFENYIIHLHFENSILINEIGYPADWDLVGNYTDQKTKDFIQMAVKNPALIRFREKFDLS